MEPIERATQELKDLHERQDRAREAIVSRIEAVPVSPHAVVDTVSSSTGIDVGTVQRTLWGLVHSGELELTVDLQLARPMGDPNL